MRITPPSDNDYYDEILEPSLLTYSPPEGLTPFEDHRRVALYLDCKPWKCECGLTNFGRNKNCAKWSCKKERPKEWRPK